MSDSPNAPSLNGDGGKGFEECPLCKGRGQLFRLTPRHGYWPYECPECQGYGRIRAAGHSDLPPWAESA